LWRGCDGAWAVIELPDGSHMRVADSWVDDSDRQLPAREVGGTQLHLSVSAIRELVEVLAQLRQRVQS
jgi:hypothetical protein